MSNFAFRGRTSNQHCPDVLQKCSDAVCRRLDLRPAVYESIFVFAMPSCFPSTRHSLLRPLASL